MTGGDGRKGGGVARTRLVLWALGCLTALTVVAVERESGAVDPARAEALTRAGRASLEQATEAGHWEAIRSFQEALTADPGYASAEAGMADAYVLLYLHVRPKPEYRADARRHAARAVELAPASSAAHTSRAQVLGLDFDLTAARREAELALQADARNTLARQVYAGTLMSLGQVEPGLAQITRAAADDPRSAMRQGLASRLHQVARRYDEAIRYGVVAQRLNPNLPSFFRMSLVCVLGKARHPEAVEALFLDPALAPNQKAMLRAVGQGQGVRALVKQLYAAQVARSGKPCTDIPSIAGTVLAFLEEHAQALVWPCRSARAYLPPSSSSTPSSTRSARIRASRASWRNVPSADSSQSGHVGRRLLATAVPGPTAGVDVLRSHHAGECRHPAHRGAGAVSRDAHGDASVRDDVPGLPSPAADADPFAGYERGAATGLDHALHRAYDRRLARFLSVDPLGIGAAQLADPQTLNLQRKTGYGFGIRIVRLIITLPDRRNSRLTRWSSSPRNGDRAPRR